jgi:hypothetical protein
MQLQAKAGPPRKKQTIKNAAFSFIALSVYSCISLPPNIEHELQAKVAQPLRMQGV